MNDSQAYFSQVGRLILHRFQLEILKFRYENHYAVGLIYFPVDLRMSA